MAVRDIINGIEAGAFKWCVKQPMNTDLQEHRCPCGRLLGRFAGRAEVKCPKCGKVNVIGGRDNGING